MLLVFSADLFHHLHVRLTIHRRAIYHFIKESFLFSVLSTYIPRPNIENLVTHNNSRRLVVQNLINLIHNLRRQLINRRHGPTILIHLLRPTSTRDGSAHVGILQNPRQRQCAHLDSQLIRNRLQLVDLLDDAVPGILACAVPVALDELDACLVEARILGNAVLVFAGQDALTHGGPDSKAQATCLAVEVGEFGLDLFTLQHVVGGLFGDGADEAELVGISPSLGDFIGVPVGRAPVESLAGVDDVVEGADGFFHGSLAVGTVGKDDVDVFEIHSLQGGIDAFDDVFAGQALVVDDIVAKGLTPIDLPTD